eukprot:6093884-Prymnesium_polylepis.1
MVSRRVLWVSDRKHAPWQMWDVLGYEEGVIDRSLAQDPAYLSPRVHTTLRGLRWAGAAFNPNTSTAIAKKAVRYIEGNQNVILAHPLKMSVGYVRDWLRVHYDANHQIFHRSV